MGAFCCCYGPPNENQEQLLNSKGQEELKNNKELEIKKKNEQIKDLESKVKTQELEMKKKNEYLEFKELEIIEIKQQMNLPINFPPKSNLYLENNKLSNIQESIKFIQNEDSNGLKLLTPFNLLVTIIGNAKVGKNFALNLLLNKTTDSLKIQNIEKYSLQQKLNNNLMRVFLDKETNNCYACLTINKPELKSDGLIEKLAFQQFWFNCLVKQSNAVIYVVDSFNLVEVNIIKRLSELLKHKTFIVIYNMKFKSVNEIEHFASNQVSAFFPLFKKSTGEYCIQNSQIYHFFTLNQYRTPELNEVNKNFSGLFRNLINKIVIAKEANNNLFNVMNEYFQEHKELYFQDVDNENLNLEVVNTLGVKISESIDDLTLKQSNFNLVPENKLNNNIYQSEEEQKYSYGIEELNGEIKLEINFWEGNIECLSCTLDMSFEPAIAIINYRLFFFIIVFSFWHLGQGDQQKKIQIQIQDYDNISDEKKKVVTYNSAVQIYFELI